MNQALDLQPRTPLPSERGERAPRRAWKDPRVERVLERSVLRHRYSAEVLRACGREADARQVERYASRVRLRLDEPEATRAMWRLHHRVRGASGFSLLQRSLEGAMSLCGADFGNVQLWSSTLGGLRIACQSGFDLDFIRHFSVVDGGTSACGRAATGGTQTVIADIEEDEAFAPHRDIAVASGFRAVQSTPLADADGRVIGVISTHFREPHRPSDLTLDLMDWYGSLVANAITTMRAAA